MATSIRTGTYGELRARHDIDQLDQGRGRNGDIRPEKGTQLFCGNELRPLFLAAVIENAMKKNACARLVPLCALIHKFLYVWKNTDAARGLLPRLRSLLSELPDDDGSIIGAEAMAIYSELSGDLPAAIASRRREVDLMEALHKDMEKQKYDEDVRQALLEGRDQDVLKNRKEIIARLLRELNMPGE